MANQALQQRSLSETKLTGWSHTDFEEYQLSHMWTISNFSDKAKCHGGDTLQSPLFSCQGQNEQWTLKLTPSYYHSSSYYTGVHVCLQEVNGSAQTTSPKVWIQHKISIPPTANSSAKELVAQSSSYSQAAKGNTYGSSTLVAQSTLTSENNGYLVDDTLTVYCTIIVKLLDTPKSTSGVISRVPDSEFCLSSKLDKARQKGAFTDVVLVAGKKSFKAHRTVLAVQSSFFNSRFQEHWDQGDNSVQMSDITPETLENILAFMYTGHCEISSNAKTLLSAAQEYGIEDLVKACEQKLSQEISCQNVLSLLIIADTHRALHLKAVCLDFFVLHSSLLLKSSEWEEFEKVKEYNHIRLEALDKLIKQKVVM